MPCENGAQLRNGLVLGEAHVPLSPKKNGSPRFCVDYRHALRTTWPIPNLESCLDDLGQALFISVADILSAFWRLPVA